MRMIVAALMATTLAAMTMSAAVADDTDDAHKLAVRARDSYWNCLAREYPRDSNRTMSEQDFTSLIASVCPSERQNFRVSLIDFLSHQFPNEDAAKHLVTANGAIGLAQRDIVSAFVKRKAAAK